MDPNETFALFMKSLRSTNVDDAHEHGEALLTWLNRGGFAPTVNHDDFRRLIYELLVVIETGDLRGVEWTEKIQFQLD